METRPQQIAETPKEQKAPRRILRKVMLGLGVVMVCLAGVAVWGWMAAGAVPAWYRPVAEYTPSAPAQEVENKLIDARSWAVSQRAWRDAKVRGRQSGEKPPEELTVAFSQEEINSFLGKWYAACAQQPIHGPCFAEIVSGPMVVISEDHITLAGRVANLGGRVVSVDFQPVVGADGLWLKILRVRSGNLALPEFTWAKSREMMIQSLLGMMNRYRGGTIEKNQSANVDAIAAMLARQGVNTLRNQPTDNVLFLPVSDKEAIAVRLQSCSLQKGMLTLTTTPLNCEQRQKIQQRIGAGTTE